MPDSRWRHLAGRGLGILLDIGNRASYEIDVRGIENFTRSPSTLVVYNHRRDADSPIIGNALFGCRRLVPLDPLPIFIAREDLFRKGFLADYLGSWPALIRGPLSVLSVRPFLWMLHAYPMRRIRERTLGEVLEDVLRIFGNLPLAEVLRPEWVERFEGAAREDGWRAGGAADPCPGGEGGPMWVGSALHARFSPLLRNNYGLTKLTRAMFQAMKPHERATIESQLQLFVEYLDRGETLQLAPEGAVSVDGGFARIRAGLHVLLRRARARVRVLPVGMAYDFMTAGRTTVFVNVGPEMTDLQQLRPGAAAGRVAEAILAQSTITASELASQLLLEIRRRGGGLVTGGELTEYVAAEAEGWARAGLFVDPRLTSDGTLAKRIEEYLRYCVRGGLLIPQGGDRYGVPVPSTASRPAWARADGAISYVENELSAISRQLSAVSFPHPVVMPEGLSTPLLDGEGVSGGRASVRAVKPPHVAARQEPRPPLVARPPEEVREESFGAAQGAAAQD